MNPDLKISDDGSQPIPATAVEISPDTVDSIAGEIKNQGYFVLENVLDRAKIERLARVVENLVALDWPAPFAAVYDEFWQIVQSCNSVPSSILGPDFKIMPNFWVSRIRPDRHGRGWSAHRDRSYVATIKDDGMPFSIRLWIALTDATVKNSCISVLPANLDPAYPKDLKSKLIANPQDVKLLPVPAGSIIAWNEALLHWGGTAGDDAEHARINLEFTVQSNVPPYEGPLIDPQGMPTFKQRVALIGHMIKRYENREPEAISKATWDLAAQLSTHYTPVGRCQCTICFPRPEEAHLADVTDQPKSFYRAMVEASRLGDVILSERASGNINKADKLAKIALDGLGLEVDSDFCEVIEGHLFKLLNNKNQGSDAAGKVTTGQESGPQASLPATPNTEEELDQFLTTIVKLLGPQNPKTKDTLLRFIARNESWPADIYPHIGASFRHLIRVREQELGSDHAEIADRYEQYGSYLENNMNYDQSIVQFKKAVEIRQQRLTDSDSSQLAYAHALYRLGNVYMKKADYASADDPFSRAHEVITRTNSCGTLAVHIHHGLGSRFQRLSQRSQAEWHLYRSIELGLSVPSTHILLRDSALQLGAVYIMQDRIKDATTLFEHNIFPEWNKLSLPSREKDGDVFDTAITKLSNPYVSIVNQMRKTFSPPDLCMVARQALVRRFSWSVPNEEALSAIGQYAPVVEVAAGAGYWAALLKARGVDIIAYDGAPMEMGGSVYTVPGTSWTEVKQGDEFIGKEHPDRSLMLCWPPQDSPMALDAVNAYQGNCVIYIGEGRGGKTGNDAFQDALDNDWKKVKTVELFNWHTSTDALHVFKRKNPIARPKGGK